MNATSANLFIQFFAGTLLDLSDNGKIDGSFNWNNSQQSTNSIWQNQGTPQSSLNSQNQVDLLLQNISLFLNGQTSTHASKEIINTSTKTSEDKQKTSEETDVANVFDTSTKTSKSKQRPSKTVNNEEVSDEGRTEQTYPAAGTIETFKNEGGLTVERKYGAGNSYVDTVYNEFGIKISERETRKDGSVSMLQTYYENGQVKESIIYSEAGEVTNRNVYDENKNRVETFRLRNETLEGRLCKLSDSHKKLIESSIGYDAFSQGVKVTIVSETTDENGVKTQQLSVDSSNSDYMKFVGDNTSDEIYEIKGSNAYRRDGSLLYSDKYIPHSAGQTERTVYDKDGNIAKYYNLDSRGNISEVLNAEKESVYEINSRNEVSSDRKRVYDGFTKSYSDGFAGQDKTMAFNSDGTTAYTHTTTQRDNNGSYKRIYTQPNGGEKIKTYTANNGQYILTETQNNLWSLKI